MPGLQTKPSLMKESFIGLLAIGGINTKGRRKEENNRLSFLLSLLPFVSISSFLARKRRASAHLDRGHDLADAILVPRRGEAEDDRFSAPLARAADMSARADRPEPGRPLVERARRRVGEDGPNGSRRQLPLEGGLVAAD